MGSDRELLTTWIGNIRILVHRVLGVNE